MCGVKLLTHPDPSRSPFPSPSPFPSFIHPGGKPPEKRGAGVRGRVNPGTATTVVVNPVPPPVRRRRRRPVRRPGPGPGLVRLRRCAPLGLRRAPLRGPTPLRRRRSPQTHGGVEVGRRRRCQARDLTARPVRPVPVVVSVERLDLRTGVVGVLCGRRPGVTVEDRVPPEPTVSNLTPAAGPQTPRGQPGPVLGVPVHEGAVETAPTPRAVGVPEAPKIGRDCRRRSTTRGDRVDTRGDGDGERGDIKTPVIRATSRTGDERVSGGLRVWKGGDEEGPRS